MAQFCTKCMPKYIGEVRDYPLWWNHDEDICEGCNLDYQQKAAEKAGEKE